MVIYQPSNGYCYNSDTHFLYYFILSNLAKFKNPKGELLDVGSGSGILGLLVAKEYPQLSLHQAELQKDFCFLSQKNAATNNVKAVMYEGDFFVTQFDKKFDIVVSNPPFYHHSSIKSENESLKTARYNTHFKLDDFIQKVSKIVKPQGKLFFCYDVKQINDIIATLAKYKFNLEALQFVHPFKDKDASLVLVYAKKSSNSFTRVLPPAIIYEGGDYSEYSLQMYEKASTHSIKVPM